MASVRARKKVISLFVLCFGFTFAVRSLHQSLDINEPSVLEMKNLIPLKELKSNELTLSVKAETQSILKTVETVWTYKCHKNSECVRELRNHSVDEKVVGQETCWLNCGPYGSLWPYPTGKTILGNCLVPFQPQHLVIQSSAASIKSYKILQQMQDVFMDRFEKIIPESAVKEYIEKKTKDKNLYNVNTISVNIYVTQEDVIIGLGTNESYSISIVSDEDKCGNGKPLNVIVRINASTIFGARHALESLSQLITFDQQNNCFQIIGNVEIQDSPAFQYRGLLLDTARTFIPIPDLKRNIDAMSYNKLNMLHWHLSDSNSFPFYSKQVPMMTQYGAYSFSKIYYPEDVRDLIQYATIRGVKIIPELDAPAHAGNGWQWGPSEGKGNLSLCVNAENWRAYCGQPPCGQLNPTNINVYITLEKIYEDMLEEFDDDMFHMGGDEVYHQCWDSDPYFYNSIRTGHKFNFMEVWGFFQTEAYKRLKQANSGKPVRPIVWTSTMTQTRDGRSYLNSSDYIIQIWENNGRVPQQLMEENYQIIISTNDAMYLDHGAGSWLGKAHIYDYKQWQVLYDKSLSKFIPNIEKDMSKPLLERQILGGEATLWSEKVNSQNMDAKTWPRTSALAENLWSDPRSRPGSVYSRLNHHTNKMIQLGIRADQLQPESCYQLQGHCQDPKNPM